MTTSTKQESNKMRVLKLSGMVLTNDLFLTVVAGNAIGFGIIYTMWGF